MKSICGCKDCDLPVMHLGMCNKHYRRTLIYGSPFVVAWATHMYRGMPVAERLKRQIKKDGECWNWIGGTDRDGYGRMRATVDGVVYNKAHRVAWVLENKRQIPKDMVVCHRCDNPRCVNPAHLWLGSQEENQLDKIAKGRHVFFRGEEAHNAKLNEAQVRAILADIRLHSQIAADYGVTTMTVSDIKCRRSWAHLDVETIGRAQRVSPRKGKSDRITPDIVREIRSSEEAGKALAVKFGVSTGLICNIRKRRSWAHVT